ncbi:TPA: hypothetical protein ACWZ13_004533 [Escherichia coli]
MMENLSNIITALGTTASAIAAFLAIKQTIKQRKISVTPQLVINNCKIKTDYLYNDSYSLFPFSDEYYFENRPEIFNAGSGVALNTSVEVEFDFNSKMLFFSESQANINEKYNITFEDISNKQEHKKIFSIEGTYTSLLKEAETFYDLGYIPPQNNNSKTIKLDLSKFYIEMLINELLYLNKLNNKIDYVDGPLIKITYSDIDGNKYKTHYKSKLKVYEQTKRTNKISFKGILEFQVNNSNWIQRRLQKIRKSYADFITENDFNKNR